MSDPTRLVVWNGIVARVEVEDERSSAEDEWCNGRDEVDDRKGNAALVSDRPPAAARPREPARERARRR